MLGVLGAMDLEIAGSVYNANVDNLDKSQMYNGTIVGNIGAICLTLMVCHVISWC